MLFGRVIAPAGLPVMEPQLYGDRLLSVAGNRLVEIDPGFGTELASKHLDFQAVCPAVRNSLYFYIAGSDRRVHALLSDGKIPVFEVSANDDSRITSVVADERSVVFAGEGGNCISITADGPKRLWQFSAAGAIVGPIVRDKNALLFASKDTNVYKIDIGTGKLEWRYQTEAVLDTAPRATEDVVYQCVRDKALVAIDKDSGEFMWRLAGGVELLAEANGKAYVITDVGTLGVMDNEKCRQLFSVNFAQVSRYAANVTDSKIYIGDETGRVACLKPIE